MNKMQIAFIVCVNDEEEFAECRYYLDRLNVPEGYDTDIISIREAPSMTAGYNAGMKSSDAKYKVYLHQDVFITNQDFINDIVKVFAYDKQIGLLGVIGNRNWGMKISDITNWDTGSVKSNYKCWDQGCPLKENVFAEVWALDGLLLATQYDIPWREDIFDDWHLYDISQCMEFKKAGYKVAVPWQERAWCYHDNRFSILKTYYDYCERLALEYKKIGGISLDIIVDRPGREIEKKYAQILETMRDGIDELIKVGGGQKKS